MGKKINRAFIALEAGVSPTVVSAVLNGSSSVRVSDKKRAKILSLVKRYKYSPDKRALSLATGKSYTIGLMVYRLTPYFSALTEALQQKSFECGYNLLSYTTGGSEERENIYLSKLSDGRVDGLIIAGSNKVDPEWFVKYTTQYGYKSNIVRIVSDRSTGMTVHFDELAAGKVAARHLLEIGRKNFALISFGGVQSLGSQVVLNAFANHVEKNGCPPPRRFCGTGDFAGGLIMAKQIFDQKPLPDGIFARNDLLALAALNEASRRRIRIPEDVAIIGCDNSEACLYSYPQLTSIDTKIAMTAESAINQLVDSIEGNNNKEKHITLPVSLRVRGSTLAETNTVT